MFGDYLKNEFLVDITSANKPLQTVHPLTRAHTAPSLPSYTPTTPRFMNPTENDQKIMEGASEALFQALMQSENSYLRKR